MYVVLGAPPWTEIAVLHHQEMTSDECDILRAEYDAAELDDAVMIARGWLERMLAAHDRDVRPRGEDDLCVPDQDQATALHVLLGCLAAEAYEPIHAGNRWVMIDIRYHREEACVRVAWWPSEPDFIFLSGEIGHA